MAWPLLLVVTVTTAVPSDFDLAKLPRTLGRCRSAAADQIIVCASKAEPSNRVGNLGSADEPYLPKAEVGLIGDVKGTVENEAADVGGFRSNRVMVRVKIPF